MTSYKRTNENAAFVLIKSEGVLQSKPAPAWRNWQTRRTSIAQCFYGAYGSGFGIDGSRAS